MMEKKISVEAEQAIEGRPSRRPTRQKQKKKKKTWKQNLELKRLKAGRA
jgi:hypothetical protein